MPTDLMLIKGPDMPTNDLTVLLIELRNMLARLPKKGDLIRLVTRDASYTGRIQALNITERRLTLVIEDGTTVIVPFHALMLPETVKTD